MAIRGASSATGAAEPRVPGRRELSDASGYLTLISAAVTPVVMISACAVLIMGISSKHTALSDRIRALAAELRGLSSGSPRRDLARRQLQTFMRRALLAWMAHCLLYLATGAFSATVLIALAALRRHAWGGLTLGLFVLGTALLLPALALEIGELLLAQSTLRWEVEDVLDRDPKRD
jgi:hypothetical protein